MEADTPQKNSGRLAPDTCHLWLKVNFIYHHLRGNLNSSSLQFEGAYSPALAVGGTAQLAAAHCPNERS